MNRWHSAWTSSNRPRNTAHLARFLAIRTELVEGLQPQNGVERQLVDQMAQLALKVADRGYVLESGKIVHDDSAEALAHDPALEAAYLGKAEAVL